MNLITLNKHASSGVVHCEMELMWKLSNFRMDGNNKVKQNHAVFVCVLFLIASAHLQYKLMCEIEYNEKNCFLPRCWKAQAYTIRVEMCMARSVPHKFIILLLLLLAQTINRNCSLRRIQYYVFVWLLIRPRDGTATYRLSLLRI